jgi:hypothetical protein
LPFTHAINQARSVRVEINFNLSHEMNPLQWRREHQVAWIAFCIVGAMAGLFFAWMESGARVTANFTMGVNAPWMFMLWLLHPAGYWLWPLYGIAFVGLTFYATMLVGRRAK